MGTDLATAVQEAQSATAEGNWAAAIKLYESASELADDDDELRRALWCESGESLLARGRLTWAAKAVAIHLTSARGLGDRVGEARLLLLAGEVAAALGDFAACAEAVSALETADPDASAAGSPVRSRLRALLAAESGDLEAAVGLLATAEEGFATTGDTEGSRLLAADRRRLALLAGNADAVAEALDGSPPDTVQEALLMARALRRDARYEIAAELLADRVDASLDPALHFPLLHELILLHRLLGDEGTVERLLPMLAQAAERAADPKQARAACERLLCHSQAGSIDAGGSSFDAQLALVRAKIQRGRLDVAADELREVRSHAGGPRRVALTCLVAGELELARSVRSGADEWVLRRIERELRCAAELAHEASLPEVFAEAVRLLGQAHATLGGDLEAAGHFWSRAGRTDELIARRQTTDRSRIRYLEARPSEHDELIALAAERLERTGGNASACVAAAIEAARGAAVLALVLPDEEPRLRELPAPDDTPGCWRWLRRLAGRLPWDQAAWLLHATPERLHHVLIADGFLHWVPVPIERPRLFAAIDELAGSWSSSELLEALVQNEPDLIPDSLAGLSSSLRLESVLSALPRRVRRLAVVAGDALAAVPFAALPLPFDGGAGPPLVTDFAVSDLPCLSALLPLARRASAARGDGGLAVRPPALDLTMGEASPLTELVDEAATIANLEKALAGSRMPMLRFDGHGAHRTEDAEASWLQLAPGEDDDGRLTAARLARLPLEGCGTLMLGACESGMFQRRGRDERLGFVRAGFSAGAASLLAARWVAPDPSAIAILDGFERRLGHLPRDLALQEAQCMLLAGACPGLAGVPRPEHPSRWACWTLYGDAGLQTRASLLRRMARRLAISWRARR